MWCYWTSQDRNRGFNIWFQTLGARLNILFNHRRLRKRSLELVPDFLTHRGVGHHAIDLIGLCSL